MTDQPTPLDRATQARLNKLATMPVDLARLESKMADKIAPPDAPRPLAQPPSHVRRATPAWLRIAAAIALMIGVAGASYYAFFGFQPQAASASTMTIAQLHDYLLDHPDSTDRATTLEQAQQLIDAQFAGNRPLPIVDGTQVRSCCLIEGDFPLRAGLVIERPAGSATVIIAQGKSFAHPMHRIEHPSGVVLQGHDQPGVPMVMRNVGDLWMCVMGDLPEAELADIAAGLDMQ